MWETDLPAMVSASDHQGVCRHYERDRKVPSWLEFWLRQTHANWCRWERGALWFDWVPFYTRKRGGLMYSPVTHTDRYVQRRDPDRAVKPPPVELPHRQDGDHMRRLSVLTANHRCLTAMIVRCSDWVFPDEAKKMQEEQAKQSISLPCHPLQSSE